MHGRGNVIADLIEANRSCRRFDESHPVPATLLMELVDLARLSASAANLQPLKYVLSGAPATNADIFDCLKWAGYLETWKGPEPGERPGAYIIILHDTRICPTVDCDHGIAAQSILLGAREKGLAGCMIAAVNRPKLGAALGLADHHKILLVLALGKPAEQIVIEALKEDGDIRYWRSADRVHHVPKRSLEEMIVARF
jgi:nitroreductase